MPVLQQHAAVDAPLQHAHADGQVGLNAVSRAAAALPHSTLEIEAPGSFCADMWAGVSTGPSSIFRWVGWGASTCQSGWQLCGASASRNPGLFATTNALP